MSKTLITPDKRKQIFRLLKDELNKSTLDDLEAQLVIERGDELQDGLRKFLIGLSSSSCYENEEVASTCGYSTTELFSYSTPKSIAIQVERLREFFPGLGTVDESIATRDLPINAEGYFAIPRWEIIASTYGEAVQEVLDLFKWNRDSRFHNDCEDQLGLQYLRQNSCTMVKFEQLSEQQTGHDILVFPAQFGILHRGKSVRRAREVMPSNEFSLNAFSIAIMLLIHPERLHHYNDLSINCAGDECSSDADGYFDKAPWFNFDAGWVNFSADDVDNVTEDYGSASAFLSQ